ncbi:NUDIX hydrolase [Acinetobacter sp. Leaf130]|uniref:NUDIX hydrolase n=1 Tax=Acinetobacter sp. Leaf130 TaxID=1736269 RepID=UPI0006F6AFC2|nr:NUDIX hydrolase [Acinetobacter sp. Leaf130]KQQ69445.1 ADP-ribose pyrophosphatase [Acinetobacter sp. Leaf130]
MSYFNFCGSCGQKTSWIIPAGDHNLRQVCSACDQIHYTNPKIVCGALVTWDDKVLLCRRAIEPRYGYWTLPAGYMELGETMEQGAIRETWEEAEAEIEIGNLFCMYNFPQIGHVYVLFKAQLINGFFGNGPETIESRLFSESEIPWSELAFSSVSQTLKHYFHDRKKGKLEFHLENLNPQMSQAYLAKAIPA